MKPPANETPERVPAMLAEAVDWLREQPRATLGFFDPVLRHPTDARWPKLSDHGVVFLRLPDGSEVIALQAGSTSKSVVMLLGSEGEVRLVAGSVEAFLHAWAAAATGVIELDDSSSTGRSELKKWLDSHGVKVSTTAPFDLAARLEQLR